MAGSWSLIIDSLQLFNDNLVDTCVDLETLIVERVQLATEDAALCMEHLSKLLTSVTQMDVNLVFMVLSFQLIQELVLSLWLRIQSLAFRLLSGESFCEFHEKSWITCLSLRHSVLS